jgi:hypothetical protein
MSRRPRKGARNIHIGTDIRRLIRTHRLFSNAAAKHYGFIVFLIVVFAHPDMRMRFNEHVAEATAFIRGHETSEQSTDASRSGNQDTASGELTEQEAVVHADGDGARDPSRADERECLAKYREPVR